MDLPVELVDHIVDYIVSELPVVPLVAFRLTCRAARHLCARYLDHLDWTAFRHIWVYCPWRTRHATIDNCRKLLRLLARDLASTHVYCETCVKLHPFYDAPTELSPQFRLS